MLRVSLLGGFLIEHEGRSLPPISSTAGRSLFAYLVTHRGRWHTRDLLAGTFWPDRSEASARKRLSQALWQIHIALRSADADETLIEVTPSQVSFNARAGSYWLDVEEFERLIAIDRDAQQLGTSIEVLRNAADLYRGDFLAGFYDDWMLMERERLANLYLHALERLVTLHKGRSDYRAALSWARRIVLEDPVRESAHREVMRLEFLLGQSTEALQQYERCAAILREELAVEPSSRTRRLRDEIGVLRDKGDRPFLPASNAPLMGDPRNIPLIGRSAERSSVVRRIEEALVGRGGVVLIEGEPGIGKTRFLNELAEDANWRGANVLWAQADPRTQTHPYHAISEALQSGITRLRARQLAEVLDESHLVAVAQIAPKVAEFVSPGTESWTLPPEAALNRMRHSLRHVLEMLGELGPNVLLVDDVHWMDPESLDVLEDLLTNGSGTRLLTLLAYRSDEARDRQELWQVLRVIDQRAHPDRVVLGRLSEPETSRLIEEASGEVIPPAVAEGVFHETGGNPLFILETLRTMHEATDQMLTEDAVESRQRKTDVSSGVTSVIMRRLSNLDAEARVVVNAAAILGSRFDASLLTRMSRLEPAETLRGLGQLVQRGVIVETSDGYEFSHAQIRVVAGDLLRPSARRRLHGQAAVALEAERPDRIEDLAYHYSAAGMAKQAMNMAWQAGSRAVTLASYQAAARFLRHAVDQAQETETTPADYFELLCDLESALDVLGERQEQLAIIDILDTATRGDPELMAEAARRRSNVLAQVGEFTEALDRATGALDIAEETGSDAVISAVEKTLGKVHSLAGSPVDALTHLERAATLVSGMSVEEADVRFALGDVLAELQRYDAAADQLEIALALYEEAGSLRGEVDARAILGVLAMERGDPSLAELHYGQALDLAGRLGYRRAQAVNLANLANVHYLEGRIAAALEGSTGAAEIFLSIGDRRAAALANLNTASMRHLILGEDDRAESDARSALEFFESESHHWGRAFCLEILAGIADRRGEIDEALSLLRQGVALADASGHRWLKTHLLRHLAEVAMSQSRLAESTDLIHEALVLCEELGLTDVLPTVKGVASQIALSSRDIPTALLLGRQAASELTSAAEQPYKVWYQAHLAEAEAGNSEAAGRALRQSWELLERNLKDLSTDAREHALASVPINRQIAESRWRAWPETIEARLPRNDTPLGRQIDDEAAVLVRWTVRDPADYELSDRVKRRRTRIHRLVGEAEAQGASPRVVDLANALNVSVATMRRDIAALRRAGSKVSTRGSSR